MAAVGSGDSFQPDLLLRRLEDMLPFIEPDAVGTLARLAVEKRLIPSVVGGNLEVMHDSVTPRQKFRYLIWNMYSEQCSVDIFLSLLATLPSVKSLARDDTYDWLKKLFSDSTLEKHYDPMSNSNNKKIFLDERNYPFLFLLEGCAGSIEADVGYDWYKNNVSLNEHSPILCITVTDIKVVEGKYTLKKDENVMASVTVILTTFMDRFRQELTQKYLEAVTNVDEDEWPKVKQNTYINLAVIKSDKSDNLSSYVCQTIRGDADDVHGEKGETDYRSAFENIQHGERVIVQGRPGSGKTTLVHKISHDWADDHSIEWGHVKALFLIHLRGFRSRPSINLRDFLLCYFTSEETVKSIGDYIISKDGLGICFILDGLDEYQPDDKTAFVFKLIEKKVLSKAIVIVASRPAAVAKYRSRGKNVEVLGFFKKQISDYIDSYEFRSSSCSSMLKEYLTNRPNIHHMCYLPIQLAMICFLYDLFEEGGDEFPDTETDVYEQFTRHMLLRTFYRQDLDVYLESIFSLPEEKGMLFRSICNLAFGKTYDSKQVLEQREVDMFCKKMNANSSLGLLTVDRKATKCGFQNMYTFCHLTSQEFLAACHVFLSSEVNQPALIEMCKEKQHMTVVLKFFCGLADFESDSAAMFKSITNSPHLNYLAKIQCAYESKQPITCQHVAKNNTLNITENFLTSRDWSSIGFVITNASHYPVKSLQLNYSAITVEGTKALTKSIKNNNLITIQKLQILGNFKRLPLFFINCLHQLQVLCSSLDIGVAKLRALYSDLHSEVKVIPFCDNNVPKLSIKIDLVPLKYLLPLPSQRENISLDFISVLSQIIEKSLTSVNAFLAAELKSQLHTICEYSNYIKLSGMVKKGSKQNIMIVTSGTQQIQEDVDFIFSAQKQKQTKNFSALFSDYTLKYIDTISYENCLIVIIVLTRSRNTYFRLYILPYDYVYLLYREEHVEYVRLQTSYDSSKKYLRRLCICKSQKENLEVQQLFYHTLEQLEIKCDEINDCSYFTEALDKCTELKSFSFHAGYNNTVDCPSSETILVPAMRNMIKSLSLKKIEVLKLTNCDIIGISLVTALRAWETLRELSLNNCSITGNIVTSLVQAITACTQLTALDFSGNDIGDEGCKALAVSMLHECSEKCVFPNLRRLNLSNCNLKDSGISFLTNVLKNYSCLKFLGMTKTTFTNVSLEELFLAFRGCNLPEIDLSHSTLESFSAFSFSILQYLQILKLCACKLQDFSLAPLMNNELLLSSLEVLDLSGNNWPVSDLIQIFNLTKKLQELSLSGLSLSNNDTNELAGVLSMLHSLNVIRFSYFKMTPVGHSDFVQFITNENITILELCHLECDINICCKICDSVKSATSLHSLDLSHNAVTYMASKILSQSIKLCEKLNTLRLCDCGIRINEAEELAAAVMACENIRSIDMSQNYFDDVHTESLSFRFTHCDHLVTFQV